MTGFLVDLVVVLAFIAVLLRNFPGPCIWPWFPFKKS